MSSTNTMPSSLDVTKTDVIIIKIDSTATASGSSMDLHKTNPSSSTTNLALDNKTKYSAINKNESTTTSSGSSIDVKRLITDPSSSTTDFGTR